LDQDHPHKEDQWDHHRVKDHKLERQPHHHLLSFPLKHSKQAHLQLIQGVLEDVYLDIRIFGLEIVSNFGSFRHSLAELLSLDGVGMDLDGFSLA
jgi:hypothetical protein